MSRSDHLEPYPRSELGSNGIRGERPRVVIFESEGKPRVEVVELPESASLGDCFCHSGTTWRVMATRTGERVLIARPAQA